MTVDRSHLAALMAGEVARFEAERPASRAQFEHAKATMPDGVPMLWMAKWPGPWPVYVKRAEGAHFPCVGSKITKSEIFNH